MKNKLLITSVIVAGISTLSFSKHASPQNKVLPNVTLSLPFAVGGVPVNCDAIMHASVGNEPAFDTYANHVLDHIHKQFYRFNKMESADIELVFCRLSNTLGMNPDLSSLPQTVSRTMNGHVTTIDVTAPTESFAVSSGYVAKADIKYDGTTFLRMWWAGNSASSKGYLIQDSNPFNATGEKRLKYAQWDRSGTVQKIKIYSTAFNSNYLTDPSYTNPADPSKPGGDRVHYGRASYDSVTKTVAVQAIEIRQNRINTAAFACYKMQVAGVIGGSISGYRPALGTPDSVASTTVDGTNVDGVTGINDSVSTADGAGTVVNAPATPLPQAFDYSCGDLNLASGSSGVFAGNHVNFNLAPLSVFPH
ncbi:MAG: hypothetical protein H7235_12335 [Bdellovibrionaceae bacterium]|nr:hypothetical protein [Pseudobdellovibrionaceae bacterium]